MSARETRRMANDDGKVVATFEYLDGVLDGVTRVYTPGGTLVQELHYVAGQLHGPYHTWWETGQPKESGEYSNGQRVGAYRWHNIDGTLSQSHNYLPPPRCSWTAVVKRTVVTGGKGSESGGTGQSGGQTGQNPSVELKVVIP